MTVETREGRMVSEGPEMGGGSETSATWVKMAMKLVKKKSEGEVVKMEKTMVERSERMRRISRGSLPVVALSPH